MAIKDMRLQAISFLPTKSAASADDIFKTLNSVYFDSTIEDDGDNNNNKAQDHDHDHKDEDEDEEEDIESIIRGAHTESRLFFEPSTAKIIAPADGKQGIKSSPFEECVATAMETEDPYRDFRASMEEMVETHGIIKKEWGCLEELLAWYLSVNSKNNHAYIVAAFVDLLVKLSSSSSSESPLTEGCSSSTASRRSSSCVSGELQRQTTSSCSSSTSPSAASVSRTDCFN